MNIAQLSEQLKDVPQNRLIDYARNPNSVVPQFLALAEIQRRQQLSAQVAPPTATVAEDVLAQAQPVGLPQMADQQPVQMAQQLPENQPGVAQLPANMAPQGFAPGGLVAFANGGLSDDDEEDDKETARLFPKSSLADLQDMISSIPSGIRSLTSKLPKSYEETKLQQITMQPNAKGSHKYEQDVINEAKRQGIDPNLALHVLYKETGNLKDPESARSKAGALGVMQLMPGTAKELGVNPMDPYENIRGGVGYLKKMYDKYGDARLAAAAYNAGPGNVDKALKRAGGLDTLHRETRNYIAGLAQGGEIKGYSGKDGESDVKEDNDYLNRSRSVVDTVKSAYDALTTPKNYDLYDMYQRNIGQPFARGVDRFVNEPLESQANKFRSYSMTPDKTPTVGYNIPAGANTSVPIGKDTTELDRERNRAIATANVNKRDIAAGNLQSRPVVQTQQSAPAIPTSPYDDELKRYAPQVAPKSKADLYAEALEKDIEAQAAKAAKAGDMNLALAIMQTGLGMLGSKSPYFLQGIGEGGQQGVSTFAALKKQEADQAKDLMAARLGLYKYGAAAEQSAADIALKNKILERKDEQYEESIGLKRTEAEQRKIALARDDLRQYEQMRLKALESRFPVPMPKDPNYQAALQSIYNSPEYKEMYMLAFPNLAKAQSAPTGTVKQYNPKTGKVE